jgi:hypothetical protein
LAGRKCKGAFTTPALILALVLPLTAQAVRAGHWWEKEPLRIIDLVVIDDPFKSQSPERLAALKADRFYNAEHFGALGFIGGADDRCVFKPADQKSQDILRRYLAEAKKRGLRTFIYFNVHSYSPAFGQKHPDWAQRKEDGTPISNVYETNTSMCVNSGYREWCFETVRNIARFPVDGVFYDGPIFFADTCYCAACRDKFRKLYGHELPSKKVRKGQAARELLEFQAASLRDFLRDSRAAMKAVNPEIAFYVNGGERGGNWVTARLNRMTVTEQDILGSEGGFLNGDLLKTPVWKPGVTARLLETQAGGKPRVIFSAASHKPWTFSLLPAPELRLLYAQTIANGAGVWFGMFPGDLKQPETKAVADMNRFLAGNARYYRETVSEARVAVVWSEATANFYPKSDTPLIELAHTPQNEDVGNPNTEFSGIVEALIRTQTPFDVIDETRLEQGNLGRYRVIILPNTACLGLRSAAALEDYVRNGGNLAATFETSLYDESGVRRDELLLGNLLGVRSKGRVIGPKRWDYTKTMTASPFLDGLDRDFLPSTMFNLKVEPTTAQVLLQFTAPLKGRYDGVPGPADDPALLLNRFGKGRVLYFSGDLGAGIMGFRLPEFFKIMENALSLMAPSDIKVETASGYVDVVHRSQDAGRRHMLHLINLTGEMTRPIRKIVTLRDVRVTFEGFGQAKKIFTLMRPRTLTPQKSGEGRWQVVVPFLDEYEVIVVEK